MNKLVEQVKKHEGYRRKVYTDTEGHPTIGYGFNLDVGMKREIAEHILRIQLFDVHIALCKEFFWYTGLNEARQGVIINMVFNMGMSGFKLFKKTRKALVKRDYITASEEMLDSRWAHQVKDRAWELADQMRNGCYLPFESWQ